MELRDVLTLVGILAAGFGSYAAAMTKLNLKVQHLQDSKVDSDAIYSVVQDNQMKILDRMGTMENTLTEIKTKVNGLQCNRPDWNPEKC